MPYSYYYWGFDPTYILVLIGAVICLVASARVKSTYNKYASYRSMSGMTGAQAAERILHSAGIYDVSVQHVSGNLTDHYNPSNKTLNLSDSVYGSTSVAAVGVAAHECGHAIQHQQGYVPLTLRSAIVPVANLGSTLAWPLILIGLFFTSNTGTFLIDLGILCFSFAVLFQLVTLPVEFNASHRALRILGEQGILSDSELPYTRKVLKAAALTYVASAAASILQLLRLVCVPGLNCYSCPGAAGACPVGAFQAVVGSSKFRFSYYITGILILFGVLLGRFICGFLCPFGWFQELLHKIPSPKLSTKKLKPLRYLKYAVLLVMVVLLPLLAVNELGMGDPFFCKYLCPQGVLEGAIPLSLTNAGIRAALGKLFTWKACILLAVIVGSVVFYRPFCKWLCPLGAFYALLNKVSLFQMRVDTHKCVSCGACAKACKMDVDITKAPNHAECIRCGMCMKACPTDAIQYKFGLEDKSNTETTKE